MTKTSHCQRMSYEKSLIISTRVISYLIRCVLLCYVVYMFILESLSITIKNEKVRQPEGSRVAAEAAIADKPRAVAEYQGAPVEPGQGKDSKLSRTQRRRRQRGHRALPWRQDGDVPRTRESPLEIDLPKEGQLVGIYVSSTKITIFRVPPGSGLEEADSQVPSSLGLCSGCREKLNPLPELSL